MNNEIIIGENQKVESKIKSSMIKTALPVIIFCWLAIFIEGYDLVVYGVVLPVLMTPGEWGLSPTQAGAMGSYALLGMFLGSTIGGVLSDKFGRKIVLVLSLVLLSIMMVLSAMANSPEVFAIYRFIAGLGIGGIVPAASALTSEYSPPKYRSLTYVLMYTGFAFGGVTAALSGMTLLDNFSWRFLFWLGAIPILLVPLIMIFVPESYRFLKTTNKEEKANKLVARYKLSEEFLANDEAEVNVGGKVSIFSKQYLFSTILFSLVYIVAFLLIYGMNTWLPKLMQQAGYPLNSSMLFLLIFNFSAIIGGIIAGFAADKLPPKKVISFAYLLAAISIGLLSIKFNIVLMYVLIAIAGFGTTGTTFVLASYVMKQYDSQNRATAIGVSSAIGRVGAVLGPIIVGVIMGMNVGFQASFYLFAAFAVLASILILFMPAKKGI